MAASCKNKSYTNSPLLIELSLIRLRFTSVRIAWRVFHCLATAVMHLNNLLETNGILISSMGNTHIAHKGTSGKCFHQCYAGYDKDLGCTILFAIANHLKKIK